MFESIEKVSNGWSLRFRCWICITCAILTGISVQLSEAETYYECKDRYGNPVFSSGPCGENSKKRTIEASQPAGFSQPLNSDAEVWDKVTDANRLRELEKDIERRNKVLVSLEVKKDNAVEKLRLSKDRLEWSDEGKQKRSEIRRKITTIRRNFNNARSKQKEALRELKSERSKLIKKVEKDKSSLRSR